MRCSINSSVKSHWTRSAVGLLLLSFVTPLLLAAAEEWKAPSFRARKKNPIAASVESVAIGKQLYARECLSCHGQMGKGDGTAAKDLETPPGDLSDPRLTEQSDGALFWKISTGRAPMPAMESLMSENDRWHVVNYIRTLAVTQPQFEVPANYRQAISKVIRPYLKVTEGLAADPPVVSTPQIQALNEAAQALRSIDTADLPAEARSVWREATDQVHTTSRALEEGETDAVGTRPQLNALSEALTRLTVLFGHAEASALIGFRCDKSLDHTPALWLQADGEARNPYASEDVLRTCGQITSRVAAAATPSQRKKEGG